jgi:hypothetical protein
MFRTLKIGMNFTLVNHHISRHQKKGPGFSTQGIKSIGNGLASGYD